MPTPVNTPQTHRTTTLRFAAEVDHCVYHLDTIVNAFAGTDADLVRAQFAHLADTGDQPSTLDLHVAAEAFEDAGRDDLAAEIAQFNHDEFLYECGCRGRAVDAFKDQIVTLTDAVMERFPYMTWVIGGEVHPVGFDVDDCFHSAGYDDVGHDSLTFHLDEAGNGSLVTGTTTTHIVAVTDRQVAAYTDHLHETGDDIEHWLRLPTTMQTLMAALYDCDICLDRTTDRRTTDLNTDALERLAQQLLTEPDDIAGTLQRLLPGTTVPLDELIAAAKACHA